MIHLTETLSHMWNSLNSMTQGTVIGNVLVGAAVSIAGFFAPIQDLLIICFATTIVDMICGIRVARKFKQKIESGKNWKGTLRKIIDEFTIIALAHGIEWSILDESGVFALTGGVTAIITLTEMWSILENLNTIDPDGPWKVLGKFLRKKTVDTFDITLDLNNNENNDDCNVVDKPLENRR